MGKDLPLLHRAMKLCVKAHKGQDRDGEGALPYATHPFDVVNKLRYTGGVIEDELLAAGFLHDVLEETAVTYEDLVATTNQVVADLVRELTRKEPPESDRLRYTEAEWYELRNRMLLEGIANMSCEAQVVKLADRLSNLESALCTREGLKLERYLAQSRQILDIVMYTVNPPLYDEILAILNRKTY